MKWPFVTRKYHEDVVFSLENDIWCLQLQLNKKCQKECKAPAKAIKVKKKSK
jgi:hypothetical protein